jgi:hypothetical protein
MRHRGKTGGVREALEELARSGAPLAGFRLAHADLYHANPRGARLKERGSL